MRILRQQCCINSSFTTWKYMYIRLHICTAYFIESSVETASYQ